MKKILLYGFKYKALYFVYFASQILISLSELFIPIMEGAVIDSLVKTDLNIFIKKYHCFNPNNAFFIGFLYYWILPIFFTSSKMWK